MRIRRCFHILPLGCGLALILLFLHANTTSVLAQTTPTLHFLYEKGLSLDLSPVDNNGTVTYEEMATVYVRNDGPALPGLAFSFVPAGDVTIVPTTETSIEAYAVKSFKLKFTAEKLAAPVSGYMVVQAQVGGVVAGSRPVIVRRLTTVRGLVSYVPSVETWLTTSVNADRVLIWAFGFASGVFILLAIFISKGKKDIFKKRLKSATSFSFKDSWASTLTTAGAFLGTIITAGVLPETTRILPKGSFGFLSLVFAGLILVAFLLYNLAASTRTAKKNDGAIFVGVFFLCAFIIFIAVVGQWLTMLFLLLEIDLQGIPSLIVFFSVLGLLGILGLIAIVYVIITVPSTTGVVPMEKVRAAKPDRVDGRQGVGAEVSVEEQFGEPAGGDAAAEAPVEEQFEEPAGTSAVEVGRRFRSAGLI